MRYELKSQTPRAVGWFLVKQAEISYNARSERAGRSQTQGTRRQSRLPLVVFKRAIVPRSVPRSCSIKLASLHSYLYSPHSGHRSLTWSQNGVDSCDAYIRARLVLYVYIYIYELYSHRVYTNANCTSGGRERGSSGCPKGGEVPTE